MSDRLNSLTETLKFTLPANMTAWHEARVARIDRGASANHFRRLISKRTGRLEAVGQRIPNATTLVANLLGAPANDIGELVYRDLSAVSHGTAFALVSRMKVFDDPFKRHEHVAVAQVPIEVLAPLVGVAMLGFQAAVEREIKLYGWPLDEWGTWRVERLKVLRELVTK
jgi:hypothetical protein